MAWASKKQYAILMSSEEGKDLAEQLGEMEQEEFNKKFSELLGKSGQSTTKEVSNNFDFDKEVSEMSEEQIDEVLNKKEENQKRKIDTLEKELDLDKEVREMILQGKSDEEIKHYLDDTTEDFDWFEANDYLYDLREEIGVNEKGEYYKDTVDWWDRDDNADEEERLKRIAEHRYKTNPNITEKEDTFAIGDFTGYLGYGSLEALEEATFGKKEQPKNNSEINDNTLKEDMDKVGEIAKKLDNVKIGSDEFNAIIHELSEAIKKATETSAYLRQRDEEQSKKEVLETPKTLSKEHNEDKFESELKTKQEELKLSVEDFVNLEINNMKSGGAKLSQPAIAEKVIDYLIDEEEYDEDFVFENEDIIIDIVRRITEKKIRS